MYRRKKFLPPPTSSKNGFPTLPQIFPTEAGSVAEAEAEGNLSAMACFRQSTLLWIIVLSKWAVEGQDLRASRPCRGQR